MNEENFNLEEQENAAAQEAANESAAENEEAAATTEPVPAEETAAVADELTDAEEPANAYDDGASADEIGGESYGDTESEISASDAEQEIQQKKSHTAIMAVVIAVVVLAVAAAIYFLVGRSNPYTKDYIDTTGRTAADIADDMGLEYKDFLETYGLPADMPETTSENAAFYNIPVGTYAEMVGVGFDEIKEIFGWDDTITEETTIGDAFDATTVGKRVGEDQVEAFKAEYELDDSVNADTLWGEIRNKVDMKLKEQTEAEKAAADEDAAADTETDGADTEVDDAQTDDAADEASAESETVE